MPLAVTALPDPLVSLEGSRISIQSQGIDRELIEQNLARGLRTIIRYELEVFDPGRPARNAVRNESRGYILGYDPFLEQVHISRLSGPRIETGGQDWSAIFSNIEFDCDYCPGHDIRVRVVWDPVFLVPGFRFLRSVFPGLRKTSPWVDLKIEGAENS
ncbi:hypothetical protein [Spirochaeta dissipatitropha]